MRSNFSPRGPLVVDAYDDARNYREVFTKKQVERERELDFTWPGSMQNVGDSLAVAYSSDKWKKEGDFELYKHIAESRNRVYARLGFFYDYARQADAVRTIGPTVKFSRFPMPKQFAFLALFVESHVQFFTHGTDRSPRFGQHEDDGCSRIFVAHGLLGGGKIRWSDVGQGADQPFLFVYTEPRGRDPGGVHMIIVGDELDIEADGIVG